jgi:hypothetical protein
LKITVPETLKADLPTNVWGKVLSATPVVMTVVATMLAGLSSSEMTRAQYDRSLAAQRQSKAGDQWNFFQGKKLRGALQHNTLDGLAVVAELHPIDRSALRAVLGATEAATALDSPAGQQALAALIEGRLPALAAGPAVAPEVQAALDALEASRSDAELAALLARIDDGALDNALSAAQARVLALDAATKPVGRVIDLIEKQLTRPGAPTAVRSNFIAARLGYNAARYDTEARLNQAVASLFELQVHKSNLSADRHHRRSQKFFFGMLAAQLGVIISTFAMAAQKRNLLWSLAAAAGIAAVSFTVYVFLFV